MADNPATLSMSKVKVLLFATMRERAGVRQLEVDVADGTTVRAFRAQLGNQYPQLGASLQSALISINREYAFDDDVIPADGELALFPPVSGGSAIPAH